ncbi:MULTISPECIES: STAS domain-containing protein [Actinosynnema]|uniref:STAS domain-containing protein n=1 Tax=Actinosynnema TaxID=40566 RepID=UPI0020A53C2B|nr:STAS domain-containing protein [Actinosynnema pretiosum]MCP2095804.1 anti-sigma B factor antagonist [Actinosynnema pretiosum]
MSDSVELSATTSQPDSVLVRVVGELDIATAPTFRDYALDRLPPAGGRMVLDLGGVGLLPASGINALLELRAACEARGARLELLAGCPVLRPLVLTGLDRFFTITPVSSEAS